jgi:hypothetical protein
MTTRAALSAWLAVMAARTWLTQRLDASMDDESGSPTLETVVIAAGLLALAIGLVLVIKTAVAHYSAQIQ